VKFEEVYTYVTTIPFEKALMIARHPSHGSDCLLVSLNSDHHILYGHCLQVTQLLIVTSGIVIAFWRFLIKFEEINFFPRHPMVQVSL
jgi:hypothetical protein